MPKEISGFAKSATKVTFDVLDKISEIEGANIDTAKGDIVLEATCCVVRDYLEYFAINSEINADKLTIGIDKITNRYLDNLEDLLSIRLDIDFKKWLSLELAILGVIWTTEKLNQIKAKHETQKN